MAKAATPQELHPPAWGVKGFSYPEVVQPVLDRNCSQCHNEREQPGGVDLTGDMTDFFNVSYDVTVHTKGRSSREKAQKAQKDFVWVFPICRIIFVPFAPFCGYSEQWL